MSHRCMGLSQSGLLSSWIFSRRIKGEMWNGMTPHYYISSTRTVICRCAQHLTYWAIYQSLYQVFWPIHWRINMNVLVNFAASGASIILLQIIFQNRLYIGAVGSRYWQGRENWRELGGLQSHKDLMLTNLELMNLFRGGVFSEYSEPNGSCSDG